MDFHLELGELWRCPVEWCSIWKGTTQDCMDHLRISHHADPSMELSTLGRYFPPWTVTRAAWNAALRPSVSGIATDVMLLHAVFGWCTAIVYALILSLTCPCMDRSCRDSLVSPSRIRQWPDGSLQVTGLLVLRRIPIWSDRTIAHRNMLLWHGGLAALQPKSHSLPMDSDVPMSSLPGSAVTVPLGFAAINSPVSPVSLLL